MMQVDDTAPVQAGLTLDIAAPAPSVWALLVDVAGWTAIYPELKDIQLGGPIAEGSAFSFRTGPGRIECTVGDLAAPNRFAFSGKGMGATSTYVFTLEETGTGCTLTVGQSMSGLAAKAMHAMLERISSDSLRDWTAAIKACAEAGVA